MSSGYLRFPHLHKDLVTFAAADDVWLAPVAGGRAWRVSHDGVPVVTPRFSSDGQQLAWVSTRDGHPEVMVQQLDTGRTRRVSYWGGTQTKLLGWSADGRILATTNAGATDPRLTWVRAIDPDGGAAEHLPFGIAGGVAMHADGPVAITTGGRPPAWWKRYRGGTAQRLWLDRTGHADWERLLADDEAGAVDPMWVGNTLVFTSDREADLATNPEGQANLWAINPLADRPRLRQVTHQDADTGYVRDATTDGRRIVWHTRGELYLLTGLRGSPQRIDIELPGVDVAPLSIGHDDQLTAIGPDRTGDASVVSWRGNAVLLSHREGPARTLSGDDGSRIREPQVLGTTGDAIWVRNTAEGDAVERTALRERATPTVVASGLGRVLHLQSDPQGNRVAMISHDGVVHLIDAGTGSAREIGHSRYGEAQGLTFSADGRYVAWHQPTFGEAVHHQLMVCDAAAGGDGIALTDGRFHDTAPVFSTDGKHLVFLSARTFDPHYDDHEFGLGFAASTRPWLAPLAATEPAPFGPSADGWPLSDQTGQDKTSHGSGAPPAAADIDIDGFEERIVPFPVPSGSFRALAATKSGVLWIRESVHQGALGSTRAGVPGDAPGDSVETWQWSNRRVETLLDAVNDVRVSGDGAFAVCRAQTGVTVRPTDRKLDADDPSLVTVDMSRLRRQVDRRAEWRQMFAENAQLMAAHYWRADLDGVDWPAVTARYEAVLDRVVTHDDLVDLLWECVAELNTSHSYVMPTTGTPHERSLGLLGADLSRARGGWRIDRVLPGESSDPAARSPLRAAGVDARTGDLVVAVDGHEVDRDVGPYPLLQGAAGKPIELTLRRRGRDRRVVVVPLADETTLRYQDWVRSRADYVATNSDGRLGYVHVPDMMSIGWAQLHRDFALATQREGLIVDVRFNRGGHTSQLVIERLARRIIGWTTGRHYGQAVSYPETAARGPIVLVANEFSGSDGDIVNAAAQSLGIGPVIGQRTWGGVVGIDGRFDLVDGTAVTQPRYAFWFDNYGWRVENHGVDPDIEVPITPAERHGTTDPQLDRAIAETLDRLEQTPAATPPDPEPPRVG